MSTQKRYDSTVARIAGNLLSGVLNSRNYEHTGQGCGESREHMIRGAVIVARVIVAEVQLQQERDSPVSVER